MLQESLDLQAEADSLHAFLLTLGERDWSRPTPFKGWTTWDVVAHLHYFDRVSLVSLTDPESFADRRATLIRRLAEGVGAADQAREELGGLGHQELLANWIETCHEMAKELGGSDPKRRLPWFGPDMGVRMFTTARYMEVWAHSQDVYDLMQAPRTHSDRIKNIAVLGIKTFGWTFVNRGLEPPGLPPHVRLVAPSGAIWEWNEPSDEERATGDEERVAGDEERATGDEERVAGDALDFCRVVTQGRNVADTALEVVGATATAWMAIAQCFAGGPADPPKPGERAWD